MANVPSRPVEEILRDRGLDVPFEETLQEMADRGHELEVEARGEDVVDRWLNRKLAEVELSRDELEEYALSLGVHLDNIVHEGWATWVAGFEQRAAGLFIAVEATIQQLDRIHEARVKVEDGDMARLGMTSFDFVNALGIRSYDEVIIDHDDWMDELASQSPDIIEQSPLLQFFREDFHALARESHQSLRNKVVGQATLTQQMEAPNPGDGLDMEGNTIWIEAKFRQPGGADPEDANEVSRRVEREFTVPASQTFCTRDGSQIVCYVRFDTNSMEASGLASLKEKARAIGTDLDMFFQSISVVDEKVVGRAIPQAVGEPVTELA